MFFEKLYKRFARLGASGVLVKKPLDLLRGQLSF
jgi:hypothetical protein